MPKGSHPRVTVAVPARNASRFLVEALESIRAQDFEDFEAVVIDDGSSDDTYDIARSFASRDRRFRVVSARGRPGPAEPAGEGPARNLAMREGRGEYAAFLDADDTWLPGRLRAGVEVLDRHADVGFAYALTVETDEAGKTLRDGEPLGRGEGSPRVRGRGEPGVTERPVVAVLWPKNVGTVNAIMVRRRLALAVGGFEKRPFEDWMLNVKLAAFTSFHFTPEVVATYRTHAASQSSQRARDPEREGRDLFEFYADALAWLRRVPRHRRLARRLAAEHLPAHLVRASTARSGRLRRALLLATAGQGEVALDLREPPRPPARRAVEAAPLASSQPGWYWRLERPRSVGVRPHAAVVSCTPCRTPDV